MNDPTTPSTTSDTSVMKSLGERIDEISANLASGEQTAVDLHIETLLPMEIAELLEALPPKLRQAMWDDVPGTRDGEVLARLSEGIRNELVDDMEDEELVAAAGMMSERDLADVLNNLPGAQTEQILLRLDEDHRARVERVLSFNDESAGRLMTSDVASVRQDVTLAVVLRWLRRHHELPPHTDALMVIDDEGYYLGRLTMNTLVTGDPDALVDDMMQHGFDAISVNTASAEVVRSFERRDLVSVAVVDDEGKLVGRITVDEVINLMRSASDDQLLKPTGLKEADELFAPVLASALRRAVWLGINLITVFFAAWVIGRFEEALDKIVALAILMPVVASMGGIAGSQTLALTLIGMSTDRIAPSNLFWLVRKEIAVGVLNGVVWAVVVGIVSYLWFGSWGIGAVLGAAMLLNLIAAAAFGVFVPLTLKRLGADPALSGAVVLTTVTDVVGFLGFLGLATMFLL